MTNNTGDTQEEGVYLNTVAEQIGRQFADRILARNLFVCTNNDGNPVRQMVDGIKEAVLYFHTNFNGCWNTRHPEPTGDRMAAIDLNNGVREKIIEAAKGLAMGEDWNNGTHAKIYRPQLLAAIALLAGDGK